MKKFIRNTNTATKIVAARTADQRYILTPPNVLDILMGIEELKDYHIAMTESPNGFQFTIGESVYEIAYE
jgi:hypothetical protein